MKTIKTSAKLNKLFNQILDTEDYIPFGLFQKEMNKLWKKAAMPMFETISCQEQVEATIAMFNKSIKEEKDIYCVFWDKTQEPQIYLLAKSTKEIEQLFKKILLTLEILQKNTSTKSIDKNIAFYEKVLFDLKTKKHKFKNQSKRKSSDDI